METRHQIQGQQPQKHQMHPPAMAVDTGQKHRIDTFEHQRPEDQSQHNQADAGGRDQQYQRCIIQCQNRPEQDMKQIEIGAFDRQQHHPACQ